MVVPSPEAATLTLWSGESRATLPVLPADRIRAVPDFPPVAKAAPLARTVHDSGGEKREVHYDAELDKTTVRNTRNDGSARIDDIDTTISYGKVKEFSIARNDPETAESVISTTMHYRRAGWDARLQTRIRMRCRAIISSSIPTSMPSRAASAASAAASPIRSPATICEHQPVSQIRIRDDLPEAFEILDPVWIPMPDGKRLAARILLPRSSEELPVPAVLEYIPYRRRDGTILGDMPRHAYFAGHGYAAVRVDLRGAGDSDGLLLDEYLAQEHDDALAVIDWLSTQAGATARSG
jgi:Predicted acyl esterases